MTESSSLPTLLIADDEPSVRDVIIPVGIEEGFDVVTADGGAEALFHLQNRRVDLALVDIRMPDVDGLEVLRRIKAERGDCEVVLMTGYAAVDSAVQAIRFGARDYLTKPFDFDRLRALLAEVRQAVERRQRVCRLEGDVARELEFCGMIGRGVAMQQLFAAIRRLAPHLRMALVTGETGTGKELVAHALHVSGPRARGKFVAVNCSAIVENLFESELFGHTRGAFTGAVDAKTGLFEAAAGGTLFLDEIGELPLVLQAKLLRVLETGEIPRVGAVQPRRVDVRVIAATNRDLRAEAAAGRFRSDLFYRLGIVELALPPLRDRREDIPYLVAAMINSISAQINKRIVGVTPEAERLLVESPWPGNVRELRNVVERSCITAEEPLISERDVRVCLNPAKCSTAEGHFLAAGVEPGQRQEIAKIECEMIRRVLEQNGGDRSRTARALGISRRTLYRRLYRFGLM